MAESSTVDPPGPSGKIRVYTRGGDAGMTSLFTGVRTHKDTHTLSALGDVDELNAGLGLAAEYSKAQGGLEGLLEQLVEIQSRLIDVGSAVATPLSAASHTHVHRVAFPPDATELLEGWIDAMDDQLPPLRNFILPSGGLAASQLHVCRTVCRRAERSVTTLVRAEEVPVEVSKYLNRLSDFLFVAARFAAMKASAIERVYKKSKGLTERPLAPATEK